MRTTARPAASRAPTREARMRARMMAIPIVAAAAAAAPLFAGWSGGRGAPRLAPPRAAPGPRAPPTPVGRGGAPSVEPARAEPPQRGHLPGRPSPEFLSALRAGMIGKVAVTYFEWAGLHDQKIIVPWRLVDGPESADALAVEIARAPYRRAPRTSIYGALQFAKPLFDASGYHGARRVIDVSGDGPNNMGPSVTLARDEVLAAGITINGLPIMLGRPGGGFGMYRVYENLDVYYEDCVIGGPGSFVIGIKERAQFKDATRAKLVQEIAGRTPEARVIPAEAKAPRTYCS